MADGRGSESTLFSSTEGVLYKFLTCSSLYFSLFGGGGGADGGDV